MAGPIPLLQDTHHQRNVPEPFAETIAPPPIDVDGLSQVVDHPALVSSFFFISLNVLYSLTNIPSLFRRNVVAASAANSVASHATSQSSGSRARHALSPSNGAPTYGLLRSACSLRTSWGRVLVCFQTIVRSFYLLFLYSIYY